jgi:hypothetical protein
MNALPIQQICYSSLRSSEYADLSGSIAACSEAEMVWGLNQLDRVMCT